MSDGIISYSGNSMLMEMERKKKEALEATNVNIKPRDELTTHVLGRWDRAKRAKQRIEQTMMDALRSVNGEYPLDKLQAIREAGTSEIYMMLTAQKSRDAKAWILDVYQSSGDRPWSIDPTPVPDLPPNIKQKIQEHVVELMDKAVEIYYQQTGVPVSMEEFNKVVVSHQEEMIDKVKTRITEKARKSAEKMTAKIDDQLSECQWQRQFRNIIDDLVKYPSAIMKVPVLRRKKTLDWGILEGKWEPDVKDAISIDIERVSPFDIYPAPDAEDIEDGYLFERHRLTKFELTQFIGVPGWNEEALRDVLETYKVGGLRDWLTTDAERAKLEQKNDTAILESEKIDALQFWGNIQGRLLKEWGMKAKDIPDDDMEYPVEIWVVNSQVVKSILNPDKLGRKPYFKISWEAQAGAFWGKSIPDIIADLQEACNQHARAIINNTAYASGPISEIDIDRLEDPTDTQIRPMREYLLNTRQYKEGYVVRFTNIPFIANQLITIYNKFKQDMDEVLGLIAPGTRPGKAIDTAAGFSMARTDASRGIKYVVISVDEMVGEMIRRIYDFNMIYDEDESIKGDLRIKAKGASSFVAKEQLAVRRNEFLQTTMNPIDSQIIGPAIRKDILREQAKTLDLPKIAEMLAESELPMTDGTPQLMPRGGQAPPPSPTTLNAAGQPAGGMEQNIFQGARA